MQLNYDRIIQIFQNNMGPISVPGTPLDEFFKAISTTDRSQVEYFIRTELKGDPINEVNQIFPGMYWGSDGIQNLTIPASVKQCAEGVFKDSDLQNVVISSPLDGILNLDIFAGARNLKSIKIDPAVAGNFKGLKATILMNNRPTFKLYFPSALLDGLENGSISVDANQAFMDYISADNNLQEI